QSHGPLFQVMLALQNNEQGALELPNLTLSQVQHDNTIAKYDLTLNAGEGVDGLTLGWEYNTDLFEEATIARMAGHFGLLLASLVGAPQAKVFAANMMAEAERRQLLLEWNDTAAIYPHERCIASLFEEQAARAGDAIALVFGDDQMSYGELNARANRLAHYLVQQRQVGPDSLVGVCVERSAAMVVAILAILKAGGAYVPLDSSYPVARLAYMLEDAQLSTVLTETGLREQTGIGAAQALCLDDAQLMEQLALQPASNLAARGLTPRHLAYVIYTSGSTGQPKGVMVEQRSVVRLVRNAGFVDLTAADVVAQASNMSFDAITFELWGALLNGARLVYLSKDTLLDVAALQSAIDAQQISTLFITTALFNSIAADAPQALGRIDKVLFGGEDCSLHAIRQIAAHGKPRRLLHVYGPTENTTFSLWKQLDADYIARVHKVALGRSLNNTRSYVLDAHGALAPVGVGGELYLDGAGLARGYLNRPEMTAEKFVANPFRDAQDAASGERLYRTGDLVRWLADGDLEFLGRIDQQVKVRGFRIELGEIENALAAHALVRDVAVLARTAVGGEKRLVAYVVADASALPAQDEVVATLRDYLGRTLPDYMVPAAFMLLERLPVTPNGKLDRKALPEPDAGLLQTVYVAPRTETEQVLCAIWQELLGLE
ncbi:MAG: amino acid adenylation domain-containing protein, partial [Pseudomonadota bacterium]